MAEDSFEILALQVAQELRVQRLSERGRVSEFYRSPALFHFAMKHYGKGTLCEIVAKGKSAFPSGFPSKSSLHRFYKELREAIAAKSRHILGWQPPAPEHQPFLNPCPFCGGPADLMTPELDLEDLSGTVMCMSCHACGPQKDDWRKAVAARNRRSFLTRNDA